MVTKRDVTPLGLPDDDGSFSEIQEEFENCYGDLMDSAFFAIGRTIVLHLEPEKTIDTSGVQASTPAVRYNPFQRRAGRQVPSTISTTRMPAVRLVHRDVEYIAQIKHGPKDADDKGGIELLRGEVMTTTVLASQKHLNGAITATIDGGRFKLEWTRPIGFRDVRYLMAKWTSIDEVENP
jgi:hypothetical protein